MTGPKNGGRSGLLELLEYCESDQIQIGAICDSGLSKEADYKNLHFRSFYELDYFQKLYKKIYSLIIKGPTVLIDVSERTHVFEEDNLKIIALAPDAYLRRQIQLKAFREIDYSIDSRLNHLSIVLHISLGAFSALLLADSELRDQKRILGNNKKLKGKVRLFKISHHGSSRNYYHNLLKLFHRKNNSIAVISAGCAYDCPSKKVFEELGKLKVPTYATNSFDFTAGLGAIDNSLPGVSPDMMDEMDRFTDPPFSNQRIIPYHGDIMIDIKDNSCRVTTAINRSAIMLQ